MAWTEERWTDEIAEIITSTEYMNAVVNIIDPTLVTTTWDIDTNTPTVTGNAVVARHVMARINWPLRSVTDAGTTDADPSVIRAGRITIPWSEFSGPIRTGMQFVVIDGGDNPDMSRYVYRIDEAINGSNSASRAMKIAVDGESPQGAAFTSAYQ